MRSLEEVARIWASRRLNIPIERIGEVSFDASEGYHYSELTFEYGDAEATIEVWSTHRNPRLTIETIKLLDEFQPLLIELIAIAQEETDE